MDTWIAILFVVTVFIGGPIFLGLASWRIGLRQTLFFSQAFFSWVVFTPVIVIVIQQIGNWLLDNPSNTLVEVTTVGVIAVYLFAFYSFGFLHGTIRRKRNEGIIAS